MADESTPTQAADDQDLLPYDDGPTEDLRKPDDVPFPIGQFAYIGQAMTVEQFAEYVSTYAFGSIPPDYVVLHHSANPCTRQAYWHNPPPSVQLRVWDGDEEGKSPDAIKQQRKERLDGLMRHYRSLGWTIGPHIFIDDRWIWLFTPMSKVGAHALAYRGNPQITGNGYNSQGKLHYSVGIEVLGYYEHVAWPPDVAERVGACVALLKQRLGTFEIEHRPLAGGISSHRDYNKPACPGRAITENLYLDVVSAGWSRLQQQYSPGRYKVIVTGAHIWEGPGRSDFAIAWNGTARLEPNSVLEFDSFKRGEAINGNVWWGHLADGNGFVSMTVVQAV